MSNSEKIQVVMNTLQQLIVPATFDNADKLVGIYQYLVEVRDDLKAGEENGKTNVEKRE